MNNRKVYFAPFTPDPICGKVNSAIVKFEDNQRQYYFQIRPDNSFNFWECILKKADNGDYKIFVNLNNPDDILIADANYWGELWNNDGEFTIRDFDCMLNA